MTGSTIQITAKPRLYALDALRGGCAISLMFYHLFAWNGTNVFQIGTFGVYLFYVLSGFSMWYVYAERPLTPRMLRAFFLARFARIFPLYFLACLISVTARLYAKGADGMNAALHKIPLVIWGEHGYQDLCGQFSMNDFIEWTYRNRLEHFARGYEWNYMVGMEGIEARDMAIYQYPTDQEIYDLGLRGIFLSNYTRWEANAHTKLVIQKYGFETSDTKFDRTYRTMSNLDDMHENGGHDYLKFIKFGYGRSTDHTSKDIRARAITREQGVELVHQYDHVYPSDMKRWFDYSGMSKAEFDAIANTFRDRRVWWKENGEWKKRNIWDKRQI